MDRDTAAKVIASALSAGDHLDRISALSDAISEEAEKAAFRKAIGEILGALYTDIMMPVLAKYPDLDPEK